MSSEAHRRAVKKWNENNKEKINELKRERYACDEEFREHLQERNRERYRALSPEDKQKVCDKQRKYRKAKYYNDEEYRERIKRKSLERYYRLKALKEKDKDV